MPLNLYAHANPGLQKAAAEGFDEVLETLRDVGEINQWREYSLEIHEAGLRRANSESRRLSLR